MTSREQWKRTKGAQNVELCVRCGERPPVAKRRVCRRCRALEEDERRRVKREALTGGEVPPCSVAGCDEPRVVWASQVSSYCRSHAAAKHRAANVKHSYGLSPQDVVDLMARAGNGCQICRSTDKLVIDHDHATRAVRGILCDVCNKGLGNFKDNVALLQRAIEYLTVERVQSPATGEEQP